MLTCICARVSFEASKEVVRTHAPLAKGFGQEATLFALHLRPAQFPRAVEAGLTFGVHHDSFTSRGLPGRVRLVELRVHERTELSKLLHFSSAACSRFADEGKELGRDIERRLCW